MTMRFPKIALVGLAALALVPVARGDGSGDAARALFGGRSTIATAAYNMGVSPSETLIIRFLERPLKIPVVSSVGDWLQSHTGGTASHVQIVAYDSNGKMVDNFGLTSSKTSLGTELAAIEVEKPRDIERKYNHPPLGEITMTAADYIRTRDETKAQIKYYSPLNNVNLDGATRTGAIIGGTIDSYMGGKALRSLPIISGEMVGKIAGMVIDLMGGGAAVSAYQATEGKTLGIVNDAVARMCFPAENCHYLPIRFMMNGDGRYQVNKPYTIPGPSEPDETAEDSATEGDLALPSRTMEDTREDGSSGMSKRGMCEIEFSERNTPDDDALRAAPQETPDTEESPSDCQSNDDGVSQETSPEEDEPQPSPQPAHEAVENTPEAVAVAWLKAYNARDIARMEELSTREFVEIWEIERNDFPDPPENWRNATIETIETDSHEVTSDNPDLEPVEIGVECVCTGADSSTYHGGIVLYRSKSSGLYKVGFALVFPPD